MVDEEPHDRLLDSPDHLVDFDVPGASPIYCVHQFPVDVELALPGRRIADSHWEDCS